MCADTLSTLTDQHLEDGRSVENAKVNINICIYIYIEILCFYVVSVGMGADPVCNARDCKKFNVTKVITKNTKLKFNAFLKQQRMPFVFFVDTEPMLIPRDQFDSDGF